MRANKIVACLTVFLPLLLGSFSGKASAQLIGFCTPSLGEAYLDVNNVRARIPNSGSLFYRGEPHVYKVPRFSKSNAIFAGALWVGGMVDGRLHAAATRYGPWEFWAGPLDDQGNAPIDCATYDRVYSVRRSDLGAFETTGSASNKRCAWQTGMQVQTLLQVQIVPPP